MLLTEPYRMDVTSARYRQLRLARAAAVCQSKYERSGRRGLKVRTPEEIGAALAMRRNPIVVFNGIR
jgi:hypothetical protein